MTQNIQPNYAAFVEAMIGAGWEWTAPFPTRRYGNKRDRFACATATYLPDGTYINATGERSNCGTWDVWQAAGKTPPAKLGEDEAT